jgi:5-(aminomethyl)-3-furanmethanol phosphate kinase
LKPLPLNPIRVIKLGGSLLELPDLTARLRDWLPRQSQMLNLCVVGGGRPVQRIKDNSRSVDSSATHWECIRRMDRHAISLSQTSQDWRFIESLNSLPFVPSTTLNFFKTEQWLRKTITCLPETWDVTSDSIAAVLARFLDAHELILLKSTLPPIETKLTQLMDIEFVDRHFKTAVTSTASDQLTSVNRIKFVNFRDENFAEQILRWPQTD